MREVYKRVVDSRGRTLCELYYCDSGLCIERCPACSLGEYFWVLDELERMGIKLCNG